MVRGKRRGRASKTRSPRRGGVSWRLTGYVLLYGVLATILSLGVWKGYHTLNTHPSFNIAHLEIEGASIRTDSELRAVLGFIQGRNFFRVDLDEVRDRVKQHAWVERAAVHGILPDTVKIIVIERQPSGMARLDNRIYLVSTEGEVICGLEEYPRIIDMPILIGLDLKEDRAQAIRAGLNALEKIKTASLFFWDNMETLDLSDSDNMVAHLRGERAPIYLGDRIIAVNLVNYLTIARHIQETYPSLAYIELGFPEQIAILPKPRQNQTNK